MDYDECYKSLDMVVILYPQSLYTFITMLPHQPLLLMVTIGYYSLM